MHVGDSLARAESSHTHHNGVIRHNNPSMMRLPNSRGAQDQGHTRQHKALWGYEHVGAAVSPFLNQHIYIMTQMAREKVRNHVLQTNTCGLCVLSGLCFGGASRGTVPHPHKVL